MGEGRRDGKAAPERLMQLGRAMNAVKHPDAIVDMPNDRPPQRVYAKRFKPDRNGHHSGIIVYVDMDTSNVRGFIYFNGTAHRVNKYMNRKTTPR